MFIDIRFECPHCGYHHTVSDTVVDVTGDLIAKCTNCSGMVAIIWSLTAEADLFQIASDQKKVSLSAVVLEDDAYTDDADMDLLGEELPS